MLKAAIPIATKNRIATAPTMIVPTTPPVSQYGNRKSISLQPDLDSASPPTSLFRTDTNAAENANDSG